MSLEVAKLCLGTGNSAEEPSVGVKHQKQASMPLFLEHMTVTRNWRRTRDIARDTAWVGDVVDARSPLVLFVHGVQPDEVLLRMTRNLSKQTNHSLSCVHFPVRSATAAKMHAEDSWICPMLQMRQLCHLTIIDRRARAIVCFWALQATQQKIAASWQEQDVMLLLDKKDSPFHSRV